MVNAELKDTAEYVVLQGIEHGNRFYTTNTFGVDHRLSGKGELWYDVLGYANSNNEALDIIHGVLR